VQPAAPNPSLFYLLPTARHQASALVEYIREESERSRGGAQGPTKLAVLNAEDEFDREAAEGARAQVEGTRTRRGRTGASADLPPETFVRPQLNSNDSPHILGRGQTVRVQCHGFSVPVERG